jgi:hypothetical protein
VRGGEVDERKVRDAGLCRLGHAKGERERGIRPGQPGRSSTGFWDGLDLEKQEDKAQSPRVDVLKDLEFTIV